MPTDILFVHNNFPGQFGAVAKVLAARGARCVAIGSKTAKDIGVPVLRWRLSRGTTAGMFAPAIRAEADLLRARAAAEQAMKLKSRGFSPKLIIGHPGWGETLLLGDIFPKARQVIHGEYWYHSTGTETDFDPEFTTEDIEERFRITAKNATMAMAYAQADAIVCPTPFQASLMPPALRSSVHVIHEGVDTTAVNRRRDVKFELPNGRTLDGSTPVITYVNRHMEPLRGFHIFMRALPAVLDAVPTAEAVLIGDHSSAGYGGRVSGDADSWKDVMLTELSGRLDLSRVHFAGRVPHARMLDAMSLSTAHVYFTYPFVLSWSLMEAMASECVVLASDTAPVRDVIVDGENGRLLPFFDVAALSAAMIDACRRPQKFMAMRKAARLTIVTRYDQKRVSLPAWLKLLGNVNRRQAA